MIYITQLIYLMPGKEDVFDAFERAAIPIIRKYQGEMVLRIRPGTVVEASVEIPYEIHLVGFPSAAHFEQFKQDEERRTFLHLKEASVRSVLMIQGTG